MGCASRPYNPSTQMNPDAMCRLDTKEQQKVSGKLCLPEQMKYGKSCSQSRSPSNLTPSELKSSCSKSDPKREFSNRSFGFTDTGSKLSLGFTATTSSRMSWPPALGPHESLRSLSNAGACSSDRSKMLVNSMGTTSYGKKVVSGTSQMPTADACFSASSVNFQRPRTIAQQRSVAFRRPDNSTTGSGSGRPSERSLSSVDELGGGESSTQIPLTKSARSLSKSSLPVKQPSTPNTVRSTPTNKLGKRLDDKYGDLSSQSLDQYWVKHGPMVSYKSGRSEAAESNVSRPVRTLYTRRLTVAGDAGDSRIPLPLTFRPKWQTDRMSMFEAWRKNFRAVMESMMIQAIVVLVICTDLALSALFLIEAADEQKFLIAEIVILSVLGLDIICRMIADGRDFCKGKNWALNIFEFCVVVICVVVFIVQRENGAPSTTLRLFGRVLRLFRPLVLAVQQRSRFFKAAARTAHKKLFKIVKKLLGDIIRVRTESIFVDPMEGSFIIFCAEIRTETFQDLYSPITVTGGFARELRVVLPLMDTIMHNQEKIKIQLYHALVLFGPVLIAATRGYSESTEDKKNRLVELLARRLEILAPVLAPLMGVKRKKDTLLKRLSADEEPRLKRSNATKNLNAPRLDNLDVATQRRAFKKRLRKRVLRCLLSAVEVEVKHLELRYEDIHDTQCEPFACGVKLGLLHFKACRDDEFDEEPGPSETNRYSGASVFASTPGGSCSVSQETQEKMSRASRAFFLFSSHAIEEEVHVTVEKLAIEHLSIFWDVEPSSSYTIRYNSSPSDLFRHFVVSGHWERLKLAAIAEIATSISEKGEKQELLQGPMFRERLDHHYYMMFPTSIHAQLTRRHEAPALEPPMEVACQVSPINIAIDNRQMHCFNNLYAHWRLWSIDNEVLWTRPLRSITEGPPSYKMLERGEVATDQDRTEHVRCWWKHLVRSAQIRLNLKPRLISDDFKESCVDQLQGEYVDLVIQEKFEHRLAKHNREANAMRKKSVQVVLPLRAIVRLRLVARNELKSLKEHLGKFKDEEDQYDMAKELQELSKDQSFFSHSSGVDHVEQRSWTPAPGRKAIIASSSSRLCSRSEDIEANWTEVEDAEKKYPFWNHKIEVSVTVESVVCFVMMQTMWSSLVSAIHLTRQLRATKKHRQTYGKNFFDSGFPDVAKAWTPGEVGGFGFERFGVRVTPRNILCVACLEDFSLDATLPAALFHGSLDETGRVEAAVQTLTVSYCDGPSHMRPIFHMDSVADSDGNRVAAFVQLRGQHPQQEDDRDSTKGSHMGSAGSHDSDKSGWVTQKMSSRDSGRPSIKTVKTILRPTASETSSTNPLVTFLGSSWAGSVEVGAVRLFHYKPMLEKLQFMLNFGRRSETARMTQVEEEFISLTQAIANDPFRRRAEKFWRRALRAVHIKATGRLVLECSFGSVQVEYCTRYSRDSVCLASTCLPPTAGTMMWGGDVPLFSLRVDPATSEEVMCHTNDIDDGPAAYVATKLSEAREMAKELASIWPSNDSDEPEEEEIARAEPSPSKAEFPDVPSERQPVDAQAGFLRRLFDASSYSDECCAQEWGSTQWYSCSPCARNERCQGASKVGETFFTEAGHRQANRIGLSHVPQPMWYDDGGFPEAEEGNPVNSSLASEEPLPEPAPEDEQTEPKMSRATAATDEPGWRSARRHSVSTLGELPQRLDQRPEMRNSFTGKSRLSQQSQPSGQPTATERCASSMTTLSSGMFIRALSGGSTPTSMQPSTDTWQSASLGLWQTLPWEVSVRMVKPSSVGLTVGNAAIRGQDFFFLTTAERREHHLHTKRMDQLGSDVVEEVEVCRNSILEDAAERSWVAAFSDVQHAEKERRQMDREQAQAERMLERLSQRPSRSSFERMSSIPRQMWSKRNLVEDCTRTSSRILGQSSMRKMWWRKKTVEDEISKSGTQRSSNLTKSSMRSSRPSSFVNCRSSGRSSARSPSVSRYSVNGWSLTGFRHSSEDNLATAEAFQLKGRKQTLDSMKLRDVEGNRNNSNL